MTYLKNRVSKELTENEFDEIKGLTLQLEDKLDFLIGLTKKERLELPKMSRSNKLFVEDTIQVAQENTPLFPSYIDLAEIKRDYKLYHQLEALLQFASQLTEKLRDTQAQAGSEAYTASLSCYKFLKIASDSGMPGTDTLVEKLAKRFNTNASGSTNGSEEEDNPLENTGGDSIPLNS